MVFKSPVPQQSAIQSSRPIGWWLAILNIIFLIILRQSCFISNSTILVNLRFAFFPWRPYLLNLETWATSLGTFMILSQILVYLLSVLRFQSRLLEDCENLVMSCVVQGGGREDISCHRMRLVPQTENSRGWVLGRFI